MQVRPQTFDIAKIMTNIEENRMLATSLLKEEGDNKIKNPAVRQSIKFLKDASIRQMRELTMYISIDYMKVIKSQLTNSDDVLQLDAIKTNVLKLPKEGKDLVEDFTEHLVELIGNGSDMKSFNIKLELFSAISQCDEAKLNTIYATTKPFFRIQTPIILDVLPEQKMLS